MELATIFPREQNFAMHENKKLVSSNLLYILITCCYVQGFACDSAVGKFREKNNKNDVGKLVQTVPTHFGSEAEPVSMQGKAQISNETCTNDFINKFGVLLDRK